MVPSHDSLFVLAVASFLAIVVGAVVGFGSVAAIGIVFAILLLLLAFLIAERKLWSYALWVAIFGLAVWSYGFNNVPLLFLHIPLVDALVLLAVIFGLRNWWVLRRNSIVKSLLVLLSALILVVLFRLVVDFPRFGLLAVRDALFAFELWVILPTIAHGYALGERRLNRCLLWLFCIATVWFLLYPWRDLLYAISPVVGIQRPVPLFAFTTAGFLSVPIFFWCLWNRRGLVGGFWASAALLILLMVQSRGVYLAFLGSVIALLALWSGSVQQWAKIVPVGVVVGTVLSVLGGSVTGRLGVPVGLDTAIAQLKTLEGEEGPGEGSFEHRLVAWPAVIEQVLSDPLGWFFGVGLGPDLFQGFALGPDILVRKPHNDFLEIWGRLGVVGLLPWLGILAILGWEAFKGALRNPKHGWILALQLVLWVTSAGQPAMGFAYITVLWAGLTGLWIGAQLREDGSMIVGIHRQTCCGGLYAPSSHPQPLC